MMVKKKKTDPEHEDRSEAIDNKENVSAGDNEGKQENEETGSDLSENNTTETKNSDQKTADTNARGERSAEEKLAEMQDKYLRLSAEFDNYRKRTLREKIDLTKYASEELIIKLLPVLDDFERAVSHMDATTDCTAMKSGIDLIYVKFADFLKQNGIREIESLNSPFNVDLHDAVAKSQAPDESKKGVIIDVIQKGYYLQDKILRHAKVVVGE